MTKSSTALMSLIAAVPGGILALLLVWAFLGHADAMGGMLNAVVGIALLCGVAAALMPIGIVIFGGPKGPAKAKAPKAPKEPKPKKEKKGKKAKDEPVVDEDDLAGGSAVDLDEPDDDVREGSSSDMLEDFGDEESDDLLDDLDDDEDDLRKPQAAADWDDSDDALSDEFEFDDALSDDELEFDFDDEDEK